MYMLVQGPMTLIQNGNTIIYWRELKNKIKTTEIPMMTGKAVTR